MKKNEIPAYRNSGGFDARGMYINGVHYPDVHTTEEAYKIIESERLERTELERLNGNNNGNSKGGVDSMKESKNVLALKRGPQGWEGGRRRIHGDKITSVNHDNKENGQPGSVLTTTAVRESVGLTAEEITIFERLPEMKKQNTM